MLDGDLDLQPVAFAAPPGGPSDPWAWSGVLWYHDSVDAIGSPVTAAPDRAGGANFAAVPSEEPARVGDQWGSFSSALTKYRLHRSVVGTLSAGFTMIARMRPSAAFTTVSYLTGWENVTTADAFLFGITPGGLTVLNRAGGTNSSVSRAAAVAVGSYSTIACRMTPNVPNKIIDWSFNGSAWGSLAASGLALNPGALDRQVFGPAAFLTGTSVNWRTSVGIIAAYDRGLTDDELVAFHDLAAAAYP